MTKRKFCHVRPYDEPVEFGRLTVLFGDIGEYKHKGPSISDRLGQESIFRAINRFKIERDRFYYFTYTTWTLLTHGRSIDVINSMLFKDGYMKKAWAAIDFNLDGDYYLGIGDMLVVEKPELGLHPKDQVAVARLIARLVNVGMPVVLLTHSDYIIKELNTLIMLNNNRFERIMDEFGYEKEELLDPNMVRAYEVDGEKFIPEHIDAKYGIMADGFDDIIDTMNRIQDEIIYGG